MNKTDMNNEEVELNDHLLVDVGNTRIKALPYQSQYGDASFAKNAFTVVHNHCFDQAFARVLTNVSRPQDVWVSNVAGDQARLAVESFCHEEWKIKPNFAHVERDRHGIQNSYINLDELGVDRWMAIQGARQLLKGALIIIGCGTAITVDALSEDDVFIGGAILPGLELSVNSLSKAQGIPQINFQKYSHALGTTTTDCVRVGAINACAGGVEKIVVSIIEKFVDIPITILASGGAAKVILSATNLKFEYDANLVLRGLQRVSKNSLS